MLEQHALVVATSLNLSEKRNPLPLATAPVLKQPPDGLSNFQQRGNQQALFAQILKNDLVAPQSPESIKPLTSVNRSQTELSDEALKQLVTDLKQLFSASDLATSGAVESPSADNTELQFAGESGEPTGTVELNRIADVVASTPSVTEGVTTPEHRQFPRPGGNELPPLSQYSSLESTLMVLDQLSPEQFDEVMAQLPEMAASLKKNLTTEGHPTFSNVTLKNVTVINGQLVSGNSSPASAMLTTAGEGGDITAENRRGEQLVTALANNGHSTTVNVTQYRAQMLQNARNMAEGKTNSNGEISSSTQLDSGQGNKSQQHDRLMAAVSAMRQELVTERHAVDVRQRTLLNEQLNSSAVLSDTEEGTLDGFASITTPSITGSQAVTTAINLPVQHPRWGTAVSEKVVWMMNAQIKEASIKLNPASLGSIEIKLSLVDDQANVTFNVLTSQAKEALDSALPRLREMLAESGIALNDTHVSDQSEHQDNEPHESLENSAHQAGEQRSHPDEPIAQGVMEVNAQTGVDIYI